MNQPAAGQALYRQGELHRLRGEFAAAEEAYREASRCGREPQPGLALLRLAQGDGDAAAAAIRRALRRDRRAGRRARGCCPPTSRSCWPSASSSRRAAPAASSRRSPTRYESGMLAAMAAHARGAVDLAGATPAAALVALRRAGRCGRELEAPYEAARARVLVGLACRALGDDDAAALELEAARERLRTSSARRPTSPASTRSPSRRRRAQRTG